MRLTPGDYNSFGYVKCLKFLKMYNVHRKHCGVMTADMLSTSYSVLTCCLNLNIKFPYLKCKMRWLGLDDLSRCFSSLEFYESSVV